MKTKNASVSEQKAQIEKMGKIRFALGLLGITGAVGYTNDGGVEFRAEDPERFAEEIQRVVKGMEDGAIQAIQRAKINAAHR